MCPVMKPAVIVTARPPQRVKRPFAQPAAMKPPRIVVARKPTRRYPDAGRPIIWKSRPTND